MLGSDLGSGPAVQSLDLRDRPAVGKWLEACQPDAVIHAGAISGAMVAGDNPDLITAVNVMGTANVLAAMTELGISRLVFLSSIAVYAPRSDRSPVDESSPLASSTSYGMSKIEAERLVRNAVFSGLLRGSCVLRLSSVYGAGRKTPYLISDLALCAAAGRPAQVTDETCNMRQFIHVDDCARSIVLALQRAGRGFECFNVTGGSYASELEIAQLAAAHLNDLTWQVVRGKEPGDGEFGPLDITRARDLLGYEPRVTLAQGLALTYRARAADGIR